MAVIFPNQKLRAYWPGAEWLHHEPDFRNVSSAALADAISYADSNSSSSLVVSRDGYIVSESYFNGTDPEALIDGKSFGKSITSAAIGAALHQGLISSLDTPVSSILGAWPNNQNYGDLNVRHLLNHTSGVAIDFATMEATNDWTAFILASVPAFAPGTSFLYNSGNMLASAVISAVAGVSMAQFVETSIFDKLGITNYTWEADPSGVTKGDGFLFLKPTDFLRLGMMFNSDGLWNGERLLALGYMEEAMAPAALDAVDKTAVSVWNTSPTAAVENKPFDYGYDFICRSISGVPLNTFFSFGGNGTIVGMISSPSLDTFFIRTGTGPTHPDETFMETLTALIAGGLGVKLVEDLNGL